ncbi:LysR family transcriptional regulator (plasmid) [Bosea sp. F3-2]|uniref:LysR family transcriptional regulator n=1 Tax=Bosea sp. F3-2 TaxID=2599640 RepID=UPI0011F04B34|nr:LysR family transcriptional regulator [Bosea sp. F3-2]QEL27022.1 LysR family transcriptional regulator [Bosea sp. F3-2]
MDISPRQLAHLLAIHRTGSLLRAAERLGVAQPSLSVSIARLEDVTGHALVERGRHGAKLTPAGLTLLRHAESLEAVLRTAGEEMQNVHVGIAGPLTVGGTPLSASSIIPDILSSLCREHPAMACNVIEGSDDDLLAGLLTHRIDVVISTISGHGSSGREREDVANEPLFGAGVAAVVRQGHPLAGEGELSLLDHKNALWVMPPEGSTFTTLVEALFTTAGLTFPTRIVRAAPFGVLKEIVRRTDGITILSHQIVRSELEDGSLVALPLREQPARRVFGLRTLKQRPTSALARRFIEIAREKAAHYDHS